MSDEPGTGNPQDPAPQSEPSPSESPFPMPPLEIQEKGADPPNRESRDD